MDQILDQLEAWFTARPMWLQDAARRLIEKGTIDPTDLEELIALCKHETNIPNSIRLKAKARGIPKGALQVRESPATLCLEQISNVRGINALKPRKPLELGKSPLTIIYGGTGSGKSGYVRLLKHACGARQVGELHGNVFEDEDSDQGCTFRLKMDGVPSKDVDWVPTMGTLDNIRFVEIYDTACGHVYLTDENEVTYEPWILSLFTHLTSVSTQVGQALKDEIERSVSKVPPMPVQFRETENASWYSDLSHQTKQQDIDKRCLWDQNSAKQLADLNRRLSEPDPVDRAKSLRTTRGNVLSLRGELKKIRDKLTDEECSAFLRAKSEADTRRRAADQDAKRVFEGAPLDGVGSESWRLLWEQARKYSETQAYPGVEFPNVSEEARCILCQQLLPQQARARFTSFEEFVKGQLQRQALKAEKQLDSLREEIEDILTIEAVRLWMASANITDDEERGQISAFHERVVKRKSALLKVRSLSDIPDLPGATLLEKLKNRSQKLEQQALIFDKDAKEQKRDELKKQAKEKEANKWLSEQKALIQQEVARLKYVDALNNARKLTNPRELSVKKSALADILISPAYIERFKHELRTLGASRIRVELVKTRAEYGRVFHRIKLKDCRNNVCTNDVLSEGEFRIVSLAAFLADVEGHAYTGPFVFDDPISSLDQDFEEGMAQRLIDLCSSRQVIVFTHRLSLLALLENAAKKADIEPHVICLRSETWGTGEPGETSLSARRPGNGLKSILNERLPQARKVLLESGRVEYEYLAKGICSDIRMLLERIIESNLLADVVQRFRRSVQTLGKIHHLAKINGDDCEMLDTFMTKYSKYEHSQPQEAPVEILDPDEIGGDIETILNWLDDFRKRSV
ncbi:MAG: AAA family ATPase [Thermodesulfobacteriota bacterium]|nr:AAA family ATPase [Thermodesulfobacteriota bacterium]